MTIIRYYSSFKKSAGYVFPVTAEVVTAESCESGDAEQRGYIDSLGNWKDEQDCWDLRTLLDRLPSGRWEGDGSSVPKWITLECNSDGWLSPLWQDVSADIGDVLSVGFSVHQPPQLSDASWLRVCKILGWKR
jgi:hypothetical protein